MRRHHMRARSASPNRRSLTAASLGCFRPKRAGRAWDLARGWRRSRRRRGPRARCRPSTSPPTPAPPERVATPPTRTPTSCVSPKVSWLHKRCFHLEQDEHPAGDHQGRAVLVNHFEAKERGGPWQRAHAHNRAKSPSNRGMCQEALKGQTQPCEAG